MAVLVRARGEVAHKCRAMSPPCLCTGAINCEGHLHLASINHPAATLLPIKLYGFDYFSSCCVKHLARLDVKLLDEELQVHYNMPDSLNARQAFRIFKQDVDDPHVALPYRCPVNAPEHINVSIGGSWLFTLKHFWGLGGAGVWWPHRKLKGQPTSSAEEDLAYIFEYEEGVRLYTQIGGLWRQLH